MASQYKSKLLGDVPHPLNAIPVTLDVPALKFANFADLAPTAESRVVPRNMGFLSKGTGKVRLWPNRYHLSPLPAQPSPGKVFDPQHI